MKKTTLLLCLIVFLISDAITAQSTATYNIVFESFWNETDHGPLPPSPHWSSLVGANHNNNITFLEMGSIATQGIENIAETGNITVFRDDEVNPSITNGNTEQFINGGDLGSATGIIAINNVEISEAFPLLTLASMIAPSPDWMIAINNVNLRNESNTDWQSLIEIDLFVYDAGTDSGTTYTAANADVTPHMAINSLQGISPFNNNRVGKFTITLQSVLSVEDIQSIQNRKIFPNPTQGNVTIKNTSHEELTKIEVYNVLGKLVKEFTVKESFKTINLNLSSLKKGIYLINLKVKNGHSKTQKLVVH